MSKTTQPPAVTDAERESLRQLLLEAKPLPWEWIAIDSKTLCLGTVDCADMEGHVLWTHSRCDACEKRDAPCMWPSQENSALIAAAVNALPGLLDALDARDATAPVPAGDGWQSSERADTYRRLYGGAYLSLEERNWLANSAEAYARLTAAAPPCADASRETERLGEAS